MNTSASRLSMTSRSSPAVSSYNVSSKKSSACRPSVTTVNTPSARKLALAQKHLSNSNSDNSSKYPNKFQVQAKQNNDGRSKELSISHLPEDDRNKLARLVST